MHIEATKYGTMFMDDRFGIVDMGKAAEVFYDEIENMKRKDGFHLDVYLKNGHALRIYSDDLEFLDKIENRLWKEIGKAEARMHKEKLHLLKLYREGKISDWQHLQLKTD